MPLLIMPKMGDGMEEGTLLRRLKQEGESVTRDEVVAEIETDKATVELPADDAGTLSQWLAAEGDVVPVGQPLALIVGDGELREESSIQVSSVPLLQPAVAGDNVATTSLLTAQPAAIANRLRDGLRASPAARKLAREINVDLSRVAGSGPNGRVIRADIEAAAEPPRRNGVSDAGGAAGVAVPIGESGAPVPPPDFASGDGDRQPLTRMRQAIARRMATAKREMPHYYVAVSVDMTAALALRRDLNAQLPPADHIPISPMILKACAVALEHQPHFNATFTEQGITVHHEINLGLAVALDDGLVVPALLGCRGKSLGALAREARDVAVRARAGRLRPAELNDGTFTVSNLGMYGVETLVAIIQPGQAAILGVGNVEERAVVREGVVVPRSMMTIALSADHRVTDGAQGAQFIAEVKHLLEHPALLVL